MTYRQKENFKSGIGLVIIIIIFGLVIFRPTPETPTNEEFQGETIDETEIINVQFESTTTSGVDRKTIQLEIDRVTVAKPLDQIKFTENPDGQVILMRTKDKSGTLKEDLTQPYTLLIPTKRLGLVQSDYQKVFGEDLPLVNN